MSEHAKNRPQVAEFEQAAQLRPTSLLRELAGLVIENGKYWLIPLLVTLLILGLVMVLSSSVAAPLIYTLF